MTSLVESLGTRLRGIGQDLPAAELNRASRRLQSAADRCSRLMRESRHADWVAELSTAGHHLDCALAATASALAGLDDYLTSIGVAGVTDPAAPPSAAPLAPTPGTPTTGPDDPVLALHTWWIDRVDLITGHPPQEYRPASAGERRSEGPEDPGRALTRLCHAARSSGPDGYREQLRRTHPGSGLQMGAPAARALRHLLTEMLGHAPGPNDRGRAADRTAGRARQLLPALPQQLPGDLIGELCNGQSAATAPHHPVDVAASWPAILAAALDALGLDEATLDKLATVAGSDHTVRHHGR